MFGVSDVPRSNVVFFGFDSLILTGGPVIEYGVIVDEIPRVRIVDKFNGCISI
jgi:hypothetical protein